MNIPAPRREGKGEAARHSARSRFIRREIAIEYDQSGHALPPSADQATLATHWLSVAVAGTGTAKWAIRDDLGRDRQHGQNA